ncbi:hypothetical protein Mpsy_3136 [Methanolobus psychrophilus R15]|nr:hypothetical protein Mpsy_3136 [Methanolobus psychrophilus R15]
MIPDSTCGCCSAHYTALLLPIVLFLYARYARTATAANATKIIIATPGVIIALPIVIPFINSPSLNYVS